MAEVGEDETASIVAGFGRKVQEFADVVAYCNECGRMYVEFLQNQEEIARELEARQKIFASYVDGPESITSNAGPVSIPTTEEPDGAPALPVALEHPRAPRGPPEPPKEAEPVPTTSVAKAVATPAVVPTSSQVQLPPRTTEARRVAPAPLRLEFPVPAEHVPVPAPTRPQAGTSTSAAGRGRGGATGGGSKGQQRQQGKTQGQAKSKSKPAGLSNPIPVEVMVEDEWVAEPRDENVSRNTYMENSKLVFEDSSLN